MSIYLCLYILELIGFNISRKSKYLKMYKLSGKEDKIDTLLKHNCYKNHYKKFEIDMMILTCLN